MRVLGIETSCDETGVAVYDTDKGLLGHRLHSQIDLHAAYGGVVPELASRDHVRRLPLLLRETLALTGLSMRDVDAIAYTAGPGLAGALLVGSSVAEALGVALGIPTLPVHHLEGHLLSPLLSADPPAFPFVALLVSGGHTQLMRVDGVGRYAMLGETIDDAAGEAFDKVARFLGLGYPGGPAIDREAELGDPEAIRFPRAMLHEGLDFSFSGLKTSVINHVRKHPDVSAADNYLACSLKVKSEIVVPVFAPGSFDYDKGRGAGEVVGEIDIDSHTKDAFTEEDRDFLDSLAILVAQDVAALRQ